MYFRPVKKQGELKYMSIKKFFDIPVGTTFTLNNVEYVKVTEDRISCCKVLNAETVTEPKTKIQVIPITEVEVKY